MWRAIPVSLIVLSSNLLVTRNSLEVSEDDSGDEGCCMLALRRNEELAMRTRHRVFLPLTLLVILADGPVVSDAGAASVTVAFAGTVNPMLPNVPFPATVRAGNPILNTSFFSYNTSSFSGNSTTGMYTLNGLSPLSQSFMLNINTSPLSPNKWSDGYLGSPAAFTIKVTGSTHPGATLDIHLSTYGGNGVIKPGAFVDLFLTSSTYVGQALPTSANIGQFFNNAATLTWDPPGGSAGPSEGFTAAIFDFVVVPEPSSLTLALVAMGTGTAGFLVSRRRPKVASETATAPCDIDDSTQ
jgi:PEP-CTERM motif